MAHGASGYDAGCHCDVCKRGHADRANEYYRKNSEKILEQQHNSPFQRSRRQRPCHKCDERDAEYKSQFCSGCKEIAREEQRAKARERERIKRQDPEYRERQRLASAERLRRDPESVRASNKRSHERNYYKNTYGLTNEEFETLAQSQGFACAICRCRPTGVGRTNKLHVDHDAETGQVRGLLCGTCNRGIGSLKHSVDNLRNAIAYLEQFAAVLAESTEAA